MIKHSCGLVDENQSHSATIPGKSGDITLCGNLDITFLFLYTELNADSRLNLTVIQKNI